MIKPYIFSTAYLPPLSWMALLSVSSFALIDIHETYQRQSYRNRCIIPSANGPLSLVIPVQRPGGNHSKTSEVLSSAHLAWRSLHWKSLQASYRKSPFFMYYEDAFYDAYHSAAQDKLYAWNMQLLEIIKKATGIKTEIQITDAFITPSSDSHDLRQYFSPKAHRRKSLPEDCLPVYHQIFSERYDFVSDASVIDLLACTGPETGDILRHAGQCLKNYLMDG